MFSGSLACGRTLFLQARRAPPGSSSSSVSKPFVSQLFSAVGMVVDRLTDLAFTFVPQGVSVRVVRARDLGLDIGNNSKCMILLSSPLLLLPHHGAWQTRESCQDLLRRSRTLLMLLYKIAFWSER